MVVESVSAVATASDTTTVVVTAPTGIIVGDLLVCFLTAYSGTGTGASSISLKSGWSSAGSNEWQTRLIQSIQYRVADSSDAAASTFTFTGDAESPRFSGYMIRTSGQNASVPLGYVDTYSSGTINSASFSATVDAYTPNTDGALVVINYAGFSNSGSGGSATFSGYAGVQNTTLAGTLTASVSGGSTVIAGSSAYGIQSTDSEITGFTATLSRAIPNHYGQIAVFLPPVNQSGTNTLVETTTTTFTQAGTCDTIGGTNVLTEGTGVTLAQTGKGTSPTQWTNEAKPSTTWTNEQK